MSRYFHKPGVLEQFLKDVFKTTLEVLKIILFSCVAGVYAMPMLLVLATVMHWPLGVLACFVLPTCAVFTGIYAWKLKVIAAHAGWF